jgi:RimJ/RimL family protein N-acetyltransferase
MFLYSEVESNRFKKKIFRGTINEIDIDSINQFIENNEVDHIMLRIPVESVDRHFMFNNINHEIFLADTLVYYFTDLSKIKINMLKNDLQFVAVNTSNATILNDLVPLIFIDYKNHYFSNPLLNKESITEGYIEWASNYINSLDANKYSWIVFKGDTPIGFATCSLDRETGEAEGILYGVHPDHSGGGVYSDIIRFTQKYFYDLGITKMKVSTQIQNFAVQKVWGREGFYLKNAFYTYHININK